MEKNFVLLENCVPNTSSSDDKAPYMISRRGFLGGSALVVLPVLCGACTDSSGPPVVDLPPVANKTIVVPLSDFSALMKTGGSVVGKAAGYANPIVIAHVTDGMFSALDALCTHAGCNVAYNALNLTLDCPCHGSTYELDGTVINGPAPRPLKMFTATTDGTNVTVTLP
jgi:cytochrome b6-f complex iron-sulfur subunit